MARKKEYFYGDKLNDDSLLVFIKEIEPKKRSDGYKIRRGLFVCDCGGYIETAIHAATYGNTRSCGCLKTKSDKEKGKTLGYKDGRSSHYLYNTWLGMIRRCYSEKHASYKYYGGRGVQVCDRWKENFFNFIDDMGDRPLETSLDRVDTNGDYEKSNCRWADKITQMNNRR